MFVFHSVCTLIVVQVRWPLAAHVLPDVVMYDTHVHAYVVVYVQLHVTALPCRGMRPAQAAKTSRVFLNDTAQECNRDKQK